MSSCYCLIRRNHEYNNKTTVCKNVLLVMVNKYFFISLCRVFLFVALLFFLNRNCVVEVWLAMSSYDCSNIIL